MVVSVGLRGVWMVVVEYPTWDLINDRGLKLVAGLAWGHDSSACCQPGLRPLGCLALLMRVRLVLPCEGLGWSYKSHHVGPGVILHVPMLGVA